MRTSRPIVKRYKITPQMREYDQFGIEWKPFLMYFHKRCYKSDTVNTDQNGLRYSLDGKENRLIHSEQDSVNLFIGGSAAFGIGATSDASTIPSLLNTGGDEVWLNFGGKAYSSTQELLLFLSMYQNFEKIKKVVIFSGFNDMLIYLMTRTYKENFGSFFFQNAFFKLMQSKSAVSSMFQQLVLNRILGARYGKQFDYGVLSVREGLEVLFSKKNRNKHLGHLQQIIMDGCKSLDSVLSVINNNLGTWKTIAKQHNIELIYVLQPAVSWMFKRVLSVEEQQIFSILDSARNLSWNKAAISMRENYCWYSDEIKGLCSKLEVPFHNMNSFMDSPVFDRKFLFVDRVHLTDYGNKIVADYVREKIV